MPYCDFCEAFQPTMQGLQSHQSQSKDCRHWQAKQKAEESSSDSLVSSPPLQSTLENLPNTVNDDLDDSLENPPFYPLQAAT